MLTNIMTEKAVASEVLELVGNGFRDIININYDDETIDMESKLK